MTCATHRYDEEEEEENDDDDVPEWTLTFSFPIQPSYVIQD